MAAPDSVAMAVRTELGRDKAGAVASSDGDSQTATATVQITHSPTTAPHQMTTDFDSSDRGHVASRVFEWSMSPWALMSVQVREPPDCGCAPDRSLDVDLSRAYLAGPAIPDHEHAPPRVESSPLGARLIPNLLERAAH